MTVIPRTTTTRIIAATRRSLRSRFCMGPTTRGIPATMVKCTPILADGTAKKEKRTGDSSAGSSNVGCCMMFDYSAPETWE